MSSTGRLAFGTHGPETAGPHCRRGEILRASGDLEADVRALARMVRAKEEDGARFREYHLHFCLVPGLLVFDSLILD
jgi:hypothetical protein